MLSKPYVSIILPTFQGARHLPKTLSALANQDFKREFEVIAIDSGSSDGTVALLERFGARVEVINQRDFGHGATRNRAVQRASGEIVVFLSQDAAPVGEKWLQTLVESLENSDVGAVYARQLPRPDATPFERFLHDTLYPARSRTSRHREGRDLSLEKVFFSNVCSAARRDICLRFPFDETLIMSEDQFFARDLLLAGFDLFYNAEAAVVHSHHYSLKALFRRNFDSGYSLCGLSHERGHRRLRWVSQFLARELFFLIRRRNWLWLLYWPFYEGTRIMALLLGSQAHRLPRRWCRALSLHRRFWDD